MSALNYFDVHKLIIFVCLFVCLHACREINSGNDNGKSPTTVTYLKAEYRILNITTNLKGIYDYTSCIYSSTHMCTCVYIYIYIHIFMCTCTSEYTRKIY